MASKVKGANRVAQALREALPAIKDAKNMRKYGEQAASMITLRTRLGDGVERDGAEKAKLRPLKPQTVKSRARAKDQGKLSELTTPQRSNLTRTGQLLDSVQVTKAAYGSVSVGPKGSRREGGKNEDVAKHVTEGGRPFNHLSKVETKRIQDAVKKDLRAEIKRRLTKA